MSNDSIEHQYYANACVCSNYGSIDSKIKSLISQSEEQERKFVFECNANIKEKLAEKLTIYLHDLYLDFQVGTICKSDSNFIVTQRRVHSFEYKWTIKDFTSSVQNFPEKFYILSDKFSPSNEARHAFCLFLFSNKQEEYISLNVFFVSKEIGEITARFRVSILDTNGNKWTRWDKKMPISKGGEFSIPKFFPHSYLKTPLMVEEYFLNGTMTLLCEAWVEDDKIEELKTESNLLNPSTTSIQMSHVTVQGSQFLLNSTSQTGRNVKLTNSFNSDNENSAVKFKKQKTEN